MFLEQMELKKIPEGKQSVTWKTVALIRKHIDETKTVGLIDAEFMNCSSPRLIEELTRRGLYFKLASYSGWNTAANSSGTVIAHLVAAMCAEKWTAKSDDARRNFLSSRLVEDYIYSFVVRKKLFETAADPTGAKGNIGASELTKMMANETIKVDAQIIVNKARLPWGRVFEVKTSCSVKVNK